MSTHTPGALRAAKILFGPFATAEGDSNFGEWVASVIDRETGARELLEALKASINDEAGAYAKALIAISKAEGHA